MTPPLINLTSSEYTWIDSSQCPFVSLSRTLWRINSTIDSLGSLPEELSGGMTNVKTSSRDPIPVRWTSLTRALSLGFSSRQESHVVWSYTLNASFVSYVMGRARSSLAMWSATDHMKPENICWARRSSSFAAEGTHKVVIGWSEEGIVLTVGNDQFVMRETSII